MSMLFVTGTDTGVGKTYVAERLLRALADGGRRVVGLKPVETGVTDAELDQTDAARLCRASSVDVSIDDVCLHRLAWPASPQAAAEREGVTLDLLGIRKMVTDWAARADVVVVEGAGGLMAPLADGYRMIDLAADLGAGVVLIAHTSLGTLNHTLLSCQALHARSLDLRAVVLNRLDPHVDAELEASNVEHLARHAGAPCCGPVPHNAATLDGILESVLRTV